jgi:hypothetical protein
MPPWKTTTLMMKNSNRWYVMLYSIRQSREELLNVKWVSCCGVDDDSGEGLVTPDP